ncbi:hypothetical protein N0824_01462 [Microcystis sp. 0824]|uniref:Uncharacterized protein n=1 Tax=Microcystis aeruginosa PCC 9701 TaxID=721123 RepID=I4ISM1_MICAE|nr:hypothetical protein N0824_01462 [Microcystis sp. 0824]CCI37295.1 hypothetical protein MICAK_3180018 [Microcystis aeruginosa PCC 9701]
MLGLSGLRVLVEFPHHPISLLPHLPVSLIKKQETFPLLCSIGILPNQYAQIISFSPSLLLYSLGCFPVTGCCYGSL